MPRRSCAVRFDGWPRDSAGPVSQKGNANWIGPRLDTPERNAYPVRSVPPAGSGFSLNLGIGFAFTLR